MRIKPLGDQAIIVELGDTVDAGVNAAVCALADRIQAALIPGVSDVVPSFASVGVHYRAADVATIAAGELPFSALARALGRLLTDAPATVAKPPRTIEVPVCYGGEFGPDLEETAALCGVSAQALVDLHQADGLRVYMLGFAPGAPYIGLLDERLGAPRLASPRTRVPAGSVAIANRQSVIYPTVAPGGWRLIGRTPLTLFEVARAEPCLLRPGDGIRFRSIDASAFERLDAARPAHDRP